MACGCSGSGQWQADGYVPAAHTLPSYFFQDDTLVVPPSDEEQEPPATGYASWSAESGTTRSPAEG